MSIMMPYFDLFEEQAQKETRDVIFKAQPLIPDDSYGMLEFYCPDPNCDCRMVMLVIVSKRLKRKVASIVYSFEPVDDDLGLPNPSLDPDSPAPYAPALLKWFTDYLKQDRAYVERLQRHYRQVKEAIADPTNPAYSRYQAFIATLPPEEVPDEKPRPKRKSRKTPTERGTTVPQALQASYAAIVALTDVFCQARLNDEYRDLCRKMTATLARKRPSPLATGKAPMWAAGIIYALGQVNFLFDKSQDPHVTPDELAAGFGVSKGSASGKARLIRDMLKIGLMDPKWCLPSQMDSNPMAWMISVNGLIIDARYATREVQEEAYRKGYIPYIPDDKGQA